MQASCWAAQNDSFTWAPKGALLMPQLRQSAASSQERLVVPVGAS